MHSDSPRIFDDPIPPLPGGQRRPPLRIHARPAGALVRAAKAYTSKITISCGEKSAQLTRLMAVMGLGIKQGQTVTVTIDGSDEDKAFEELQTQFRENA